MKCPKRRRPGPTQRRDDTLSQTPRARLDLVCRYYHGIVIWESCVSMTLSVVRAPRHVLTARVMPSRAGCDVCGKELQAGGAHCAVPRLALAEQATQRVARLQSVYRCRMSAIRVGRADTTHGCSVCNWDACQICVDDKEAAVAKRAAASPSRMLKLF